MNRTLLIDGDHLIWTATYDPKHDASTDAFGPRAVRKVRSWQEEIGATAAVVAFSDESRRYFRHDLMAAAGLRYKPRASPLPHGALAVRKALCEAFACRTLKGLEADDVLGILATCEGPLSHRERVVVGIDKDLLQIPGLHFNPRTSPRVGVVAVSRENADFNHLWQAVVGDAGDGYGGCPRVGAAGARKVLWGTNVHHLWQQVCGAFRAKGLTDADALLQARIARLLRADDYDLKARRVIPWEPPTARKAVAA